MSTNHNTKSNFGSTGWYLIIFTAVLFFINTGITVDGLNVTVAKFGEVHGWEQAKLLNYATIGGYIAIATTPFVSGLISKFGCRLVVTISLLVSAVATVWWGMTTTPTQYLIACSIVCASANAFSHLASSTLANSWFPKKKGLFLGWSTMGLQLSTVAFVALMSFLMNHCGLSGAYWVLGIFQVFMAVLTFVTVKDTPLQAGKTPDNEPMTEEELNAYKERETQFVSTLTLKDVLLCRETWIIGIAFGFLYMASIGILSQWVPRLATLGYEQSTSILMLSIASAIGIFGSYAWGWLDVRFSPKRASVWIFILHVIALFLLVLPHHPVLLYAAMLLIGMCIGGVANLVGSLVGSIWGPRDFPKVYGIVNTVVGVVRVTAYSVLSFGLTHLGGYSGAYTIFMVLCALGAFMLRCVRMDLCNQK